MLLCVWQAKGQRSPISGKGAACGRSGKFVQEGMSELFPALVISSLSHDGRGIARTPGGVVFVEGALPGQTVRARLLRRKARFAEARCEAVEQPGPEERPALCPHQEDCGGCPWQRLSRPAQLRWKVRLLCDALQRIGKFAAPPPEDILFASEESAFRNKMEFAFGTAADAADGSDETGGPERLCLGLRRRGGLSVLAVPGCRLLPPETLAVVRTAEHLARELSARDRSLCAYRPPARQRDGAAGGGGTSARSGTGFWRFLVLRRGLPPDSPLTPQAALAQPESWRAWAVCLTSPGNARQQAAVRALGEELLRRHTHLAGFVHEERRSDDALAQGEARVCCLSADGRHGAGAALLRLPLAGEWFTLDAASFFQVNTTAAQLLAREAVERLLSAVFPGGPGAPAGKLLDIYCGVGAPGLLARRHFAETLGLEYDARAVNLARCNAAALGCRGQWLAGDAGRLLARRRERPGHFAAALVDPPRAGMDGRALDALLALRPPHILYISCNPATLARDGARLASAYALHALRPVDLFPHTPHLETVSLWQRR